MLVQNNGKYAVAEYSDVSDAMKKEKDANGNLKFIAGNICVHAFSLDFLYRKVVPEYIQKIIPANYHIARKQIPVWDAAQGKTVKPSEKNGIKLEMFIFDVFPLADSMAILQVDRSEQFSPVKNKPGPGVKDSPETALQMLGDLHARWVKTAGAEISGSELAKLEVSPAASYEGEGLESLKGKTLEKPCIVESAKSAGKEAGSSELNGQNGINYYYV